ncbi:response regulator transcription factor [Cerasicoccus frondis]|uniref:response regulator transcription factor n=1 Tax=Cerasicoccus frondis TaxID=490090 RepID=UPI002852AE99|nr:response regulator transcription factor [Cerasicoccus frondis]
MSSTHSALIVDDEGHLRTMLRTLLKRMGITKLYEASNGQEACEVYRTNTPTMVLMDVNMPGMNGIETLQELRRTDPDAVVVMMTSMTSRKMVEASIDSGAAHFIRKDTPMKEIESIIRDILASCEGSGA